MAGIRTTGLDETIESLEARLPAVFAVAMDSGCRVVGETVASEAKKAAPKNFGKLSQSITYRIGSKSRSRVQAVTGSALSYAEVMEDGRRAGARLPPLGPLMLWVQRKFKTIGGRVAKGRDGKFIAKGTKGARAARGERDSIARVAYALAWSIKRKGITGRKYMAGAVQTWQPNFESLFAASVRATIDREVTRR